MEFLEYVRERRARRRRGALTWATLGASAVAAVAILIIAYPHLATLRPTPFARPDLQRPATDRPPEPLPSGEASLSAAARAPDEAPQEAARQSAAETVAPQPAPDPQPTADPQPALDPRPAPDTQPALEPRPAPDTRAAPDGRRGPDARSGPEARPAPDLREAPDTRPAPHARRTPSPRPVLPPPDRGAGKQLSRVVPPVSPAVHAPRVEAQQDLPLIVGREATVVIGDLSVTIHRDTRVLNSRRVVDYSVHLADQGGLPVGDAKVHLKGQSRDGSLVEAQIEPSSAAGTYEAALLVPHGGLSQLALRIARADRVVELPMTVTVAGGSAQ